MLTEEQIEARQSGLGGSDMAAVLGIDPYKQAIDVFYDKRPDLAAEVGYVPDVVEGDPVDFGNYVEEPIAQLYAKRTGNKVRKSRVHHKHKTAPWLRANIDRKVEGMQRGLEIKSVNNWRLAELWGPEGTDQVADYYLPQIMHYMLVLDYPEWDAAALICGATDFRIYHLKRDPEWDELILDTSRDFWINHVEKGIPPPIDLDHKKASETLCKVYPGTDGSEIILPDSAAHWHAVLQESTSAVSEYSKVADGARNHLLSMMGTAAIGRIMGMHGAYTRKTVSRKKFSVDATEYVDFRFSKKA